MKKHAVSVVLIGFLLAGCTTIGPQSVTRDRFDYNKAISDSWKEQTLLNIVKLRYADMPLFVEVASIVFLTGECMTRPKIGCARFLCVVRVLRLFALRLQASSVWFTRFKI